MSDPTTLVDTGSLDLPGFGQPVDYLPDAKDRFPILRADGGFENEWMAATLLIREVCMLKFIEDITNKPEWWLKVQDPAIRDKWAKEVLALDWTQYRDFADFTPKMADQCLAELLDKAELYEKTGLIPVFDYSACVIKSDSLISDSLRDELNAAVAPLENVPEQHKDWHPGSDSKVLDLVHPSLWPLLYGRSRILPNKRINLKDCLQHCGMGQVVPKPPSDASADEVDEVQSYQALRGPSVSFTSRRFQWLPCDVVLDGKHAKIDSYVNNLHPVEHAGLYPIIEKFIEKALPAWDVIYRWDEEFQFQRLKCDTVTTNCTVPDVCGRTYRLCAPDLRPLHPDQPLRDYDDHYRSDAESDNEAGVGDIDSEQKETMRTERAVARAAKHLVGLQATQLSGETDDDWRDRLDMEWFQRTHSMELPEHGGKPRLQPHHVKSSGFFENESRLQVIVKLASIHLTPENPSYTGGSWHVEGQLNEHICATALFYYDSDNITDCNLDFRAPANREDLMQDLGYEQGDSEGIGRVFAIRPDGDTLQDVGSTLTRPGRAVFFPNLFQHHVSPFELADASRKGHRKILALFLVDPAIPVISTANVPPQQREWWAKETQLETGQNKLPPELATMVMNQIDFPIDEAEAKRLRMELMEERTVLEEQVGDALKAVEWSFCEH